MSPTEISQNSSLSPDITYAEIFSHPFHINESPYTTMVSKNIINPIVSKKRYKQIINQPSVGDITELQPIGEDTPGIMESIGTPLQSLKQLSVSRTLIESIHYNYRNQGEMFVLDNVSVAKGDNTPEIRIKFNKYDSYGNPIHIIQDNHNHTVYLWGKKGEHPVAEIKNSTYDKVNVTLGSSATPESISTSANSNEDKIVSLRSNANMADSHIHSYIYNKFGSIQSDINHSNILASYNYDGYGNLKEARDHGNNIMDSYSYSYCNDATSFPALSLNGMSVSLTGNIYNVEKSSTRSFLLNVSGGAGVTANYRYSFRLRGLMGGDIVSGTNYSSNSFNITFNKTGKMFLEYCVKDLVSGAYAEGNVYFTVLDNIIKL
jgi:YD repeat-containing protein